MNHNFEGKRPAWVEIDIRQLRRNFEIIFADKPGNVALLSVVKDQAYGHGAVTVAKEALKAGAVYLAVATLGEAVELREAGVRAPILVFGERPRNQIPDCVSLGLTCFVNSVAAATDFARVARQQEREAVVHVEVDTGLSRYGVRWEEAPDVIEAVAQTPGLRLEGVMSHFAMSDEEDKSFALLQLQRFRSVLSEMENRGIHVRYRHMANTGGFLDLPQAHFDMVRLGILPLGVYPSQVCRRIPGLAPVMSVKARVAVLRDLRPGDVVGYGMHYQAKEPRRIAVIPVGYGDGYPRVRNRGAVLIRGQRAPVVGGNAMDAMMVDVTNIPGVRPWDEVVLLGCQGGEEIDVHEIARWKGTVSYEVMTNWSWRLPRVEVA
ncbi:MAG: alanine racemase [Calditrichaeota bacterium]|nr:alanine racemase [Calditrichota bacterium]